MPGIVVGIDGSANSEYALNWAMNEAAMRHASLTVLTIHQAVPSQATGLPLSFQEEKPSLDRSRALADELVQKAASRLGEQGPSSVSVRVLHGSPADALIDASKEADMLVVGSRGSGGFARLLLGSVSTQVTHHASCPVVVVPHER